MAKNNGLFVTFLITTAVLAGCAGLSPPPHEQQFQGVILKDKKPATSMRVRLVNGAADDCAAKGLEAVTDKRGRFKINHAGTASRAQRPYVLCVESDDSWEKLWSDTRTPAPHSLEFECDLADRTRDKCWVSWDKEGFKRGSWSR
jgi:hypothetical protein